MPLKKINQQGFSLLEVLIAVVVVSIGFLATARMQVEGLRSSQSAYFSSQATLMMRDMADRMRANSNGVTDGHYRNVETSNSTAWPGCIASESECTAEDVAKADLASWSRYLYAPPNAVEFRPTLPSSANIEAKGTVTYDAGANTYTVTVSWSERIEAIDTEQVISMQVFP